MGELPYHRLLLRQMRRFIRPDLIEELSPFLTSISDFYTDADKERRLLEHTLDVSSKELEEANHSLKQQYDELLEREELRNARDEAIIEKEIAVAANHAKDIFLSNMSHELRTPLNAINGFSQILLAKPDTPESAKKFIEKIHISGNNLLSLVNTILDFSKIEAGKMEIHYSHFFLNELTKETQILVESMAHKKNLVLELSLSNEVAINADRQLIKQVFVNLLSNAIKFSPEGAIISLTYSNDEANDVFAIADHGHGIPADKLSTLFDPFVQIREHQQGSIKGTGLGLSIVKKIIELHGGEIWVESVLGEGSCFYFSIPKTPTSVNQ